MVVRRTELLMDRRLLVALALLLVNDRILKGAVGAGPFGLVTGKLSDVAAMVVGPVLVAVVAPRMVGRSPMVALAPPGLLLAIINLSDPAARGYESALGAVTGLEHRIVVDPLDLLGLAGLIVARRILSDPRPLVVRRQQLAAILIGVVAVGGAAGSSQSDGPNLNRLDVDDDRVLVSSSFYDEAKASVDDGVTWEWVTADLGGEAGPPNTERCLVADAAVCVRLADRLTIEESRDGGRTWERVWHTEDGSERWMTSGDHGYLGTGRIELSDVAETGAGSVVVAASAIDPIRRSPEGDWRPSIGDLRRFQVWVLLPLAAAVALMMVGLAAIGSEPVDKFRTAVTIGVGLTFVVPGVLLLTVLIGIESWWLPLLAIVLGIGLVVRAGRGGGFLVGLVGGLGIVMIVFGVLVALAYFVLLDIIGFLLLPTIPLTIFAIALAVAVGFRGAKARRLLVGNGLAGLLIVALAAVPMAVWSTGSAGLGGWDEANRLGSIVALLGTGLLAMVMRRRGAGPASPLVEGAPSP